MPVPSLETGILGTQPDLQVVGAPGAPLPSVAPDLASGVLTGLSGSLLSLVLVIWALMTWITGSNCRYLIQNGPGTVGTTKRWII